MNYGGTKMMLEYLKTKVLPHKSRWELYGVSTGLTPEQAKYQNKQKKDIFSEIVEDPVDPEDTNLWGRKKRSAAKAAESRIISRDKKTSYQSKRVSGSVITDIVIKPEVEPEV